MLHYLNKSKKQNCSISQYYSQLSHIHEEQQEGHSHTAVTVHSWLYFVIHMNLKLTPL